MRSAMFQHDQLLFRNAGGGPQRSDGDRLFLQEPPDVREHECHRRHCAEASQH
jgi:hypothetical protein